MEKLVSPSLRCIPREGLSSHGQVVVVLFPFPFLAPVKKSRADSIDWLSFFFFTAFVPPMAPFPSLGARLFLPSSCP